MTAAPVANFYAGDDGSRGGARVAARDLDGDGRAEIVTGIGAGGARVAGYSAAAAAVFGIDAFPGLTTGVYVG